MGRTQTTKKYEITPDIKELQEMAVHAKKSNGVEVRIDITQDLVTVNGFKKMTRAEAKSYLLEVLDPNNPNRKITTSTVPDRELEEKLARQAAKKQKKHREPGAPPVLKTLIRRSKRIWKKATNKGIDPVEAIEKARTYINIKGSSDADRDIAYEKLEAYIEKENK